MTRFSLAVYLSGFFVGRICEQPSEDLSEEDYFLSPSMFTRIQEHKPKNALWLIPLGIFTTVTSIPSNALAFESDLAIAPAPHIVMAVRIARSTTSTQVLIASNSPVTPETHRVALARAPRVHTVTPTAGTPVVLQGEASYYSRAGCLGCDSRVIMANGQPLNDNALTMAIGADKKHLVGHKAKVTGIATGKSVVVTITDTGGFYQAKYGHRVADLTIATKQAIGIRGGVGQVRVEVY